MDITIIYIAIFGTNNRYAWATTIIEDGEIEKLHGIETNELCAILKAIQTSITRMSTKIPIIIRSRERSVQQLGKNWIDTWKRQGYATEPDANAIETFLDSITEYNISWFAPQYPDALDKIIYTEAKQYYASAEDISVDEKSTLHNQRETPVIDNRTRAEEKPDTSASVDSQKSKPRIDEKNSIDAPIVDEPILPTIISTITTPTSTEKQSTLDTTPTVQITEEIQSYRTREDNLDSQEDFAYIDEETEDLLEKIFVPQEETQDTRALPTPEFIRIVAYIDAQRNQHLCVWAFVLIDRNSGVALCKAEGYTHGSWHRTFIQGCIELLEAVHDTSLTIEIRSRHKELLELITLGTHLSTKNRLPANVTNIWANQLPFLGKFTTILEMRTIKAHCYTEIDQGILDAMQIASSGLQSINEGRSPKMSNRRRFYPLDKLFE